MNDHDANIFDALPDDVWERIIFFLNLVGLQSLRASCKTGHKLVNSLGIQYDFLYWMYQKRLRGLHPEPTSLCHLIKHHHDNKRLFLWAHHHCPNLLSSIDIRHVQKLVHFLCVTNDRKISLLLQTQYLSPKDFLRCYDSAPGYARMPSGYTLYLIHTHPAWMKKAIRLFTEQVGPVPTYLHLCTLYEAIDQKRSVSMIIAVMKEFSISIQEAFTQPQSCCLWHTSSERTYRYKNVLRACLYAKHTDALLYFYCHFKICQEHPNIEVALLAHILARACQEGYAHVLEELLRTRLQWVSNQQLESTESQLYQALLQALLMSRRKDELQAMFHLYLSILGKLQLLPLHAERCRDIVQVSITTFAIQNSLDVKQIWRRFLDDHILSPELLFPLIEQCAQASFWKRLLLEYSYELQQEVDAIQKPKLLERIKDRLRRWTCYCVLVSVSAHSVTTAVFNWFFFFGLALFLLPSLHSTVYCMKSLAFHYEVTPSAHQLNRFSVQQYYGIRFVLLLLNFFAYWIEDPIPSACLHVFYLTSSCVLYRYA